MQGGFDCLRYVFTLRLAGIKRGLCCYNQNGPLYWRGRTTPVTPASFYRDKSTTNICNRLDLSVSIAFCIQQLHSMRELSGLPFRSDSRDSPSIQYPSTKLRTMLVRFKLLTFKQRFCIE